MVESGSTRPSCLPCCCCCCCCRTKLNSLVPLTVLMVRCLSTLKKMAADLKRKRTWTNANRMFEKSCLIHFQIQQCNSNTSKNTKNHTNREKYKNTTNQSTMNVKKSRKEKKMNTQTMTDVQRRTFCYSCYALLRTRACTCPRTLLQPCCFRRCASLQSKTLFYLVTTSSSCFRRAVGFVSKHASAGGSNQTCCHCNQFVRVCGACRYTS